MHLNKRWFGLTLLLGVSLLTVILSEESVCVPYQANGIKIGEVDSTSAIIWTRLTRDADPKSDGIPFPIVTYKRDLNDENRHFYDGPQIPEGHTLEEMDRVAPGSKGYVRLHVWPEDDPKEVIETDWAEVDVDRDYTHQFRLSDLCPDTAYHLVSLGKQDPNDEDASMTSGTFRTAPLPEDPSRVVFTVVTGQEYHRRDDPEMGHKIYPVMSQLNPSFFVHTGDILYYDKAGPMALTVELARFKWNRMYGLPNQRAFHNVTASYFIKDDHDTLKNDSWPGQTDGDLTWEQG